MIQFTVDHNFKNRLKKNGTAPIHIRAYLNAERKYIPTGIFVKPTEWSKKYNKVIAHPKAVQYNAKIRKQLDELESYTLEWIKKHDSITLAQLDHHLKYEDSQSFTQFWIYELKHDTKLQKQTKENTKQRSIIGLNFEKMSNFLN